MRRKTTAVALLLAFTATGYSGCSGAEDNQQRKKPVESRTSGAPKGGSAGTGLVSMGFLLLPALPVLAAVAVPNFLRARNKSKFVACHEQLSHVKAGLEQYLAENGSLAGIGPGAEEICNYVLAVYENVDKCKGQIKKRVETVCSDYAVKIVDALKGQYDIMGHAKDKTSCCIVITEVQGEPTRYDKCSNTCPAGLH